MKQLLPDILYLMQCLCNFNYWKDANLNLAINANEHLGQNYTNHLKLLKPLGVLDIGEITFVNVPLVFQ